MKIWRKKKEKLCKKKTKKILNLCILALYLFNVKALWRKKKSCVNKLHFSIFLGGGGVKIINQIQYTIIFLCIFQTLNIIGIIWDIIGWM